jgi:hypothetical protein
MSKQFLLTLALLALILIGNKSVSGQRYFTSSGIRISNDHLGLSIQQRLLKQTTLESMLTMNTRDARMTVLLQQHGKILGRRLNYYAGIGGHIGGLNNYGIYRGFDGILGLEYKLLLFPIHLSFDFQPALHYGHSENFELRSALTIRKVIIKDNGKKRRERKRKKRKKLREKS